MKHRCDDCGKLFLYPAKNITKTLESLTIETVDNIELMVCPHCRGLNIDEFVEVKVDDVSSVVQVEYSAVDSYLALGYKVKEYYAKCVTLVKPAAPIILSQKLEEKKIE